MKLCILISSLLISSSVMAVTVQSSSQITQAEAKKEAEKQALIEKCSPNCLYSNIQGMNDTVDEKISRSEKNGASIQYLLYSPLALEKLGMDEPLLAQEINEVVKQVADYFKKKPAMKGGFVTSFTFYPGYKAPYQFSLDSVPEEFQSEIKKYNAQIKKDSDCNSNGYCGLLALESIDYLDATGKKLDNDEYRNFISTYPNNIKHYPTKKTSLAPLKLILVMGTNGYRVEEKEVNKFMNK